MTLLRHLLLLACCLVAHGADGVMLRLDFKPFYFETDLGANPAEQKKVAVKYAKWVSATANYFLQVYGLKDTCFEDYAQLRGDGFDRTIRFRVFRTYDGFLTDFQKRYDTKTIPGAFFGTNRAKDEYGQHVGKWLREVATSAEGQTEEEVLRHLYHEMGHLFMQTFLVWPVEMPSWIEEGTAELFQYRIGNGTKPEAERDERQGWLVEMVAEGSAIPWPEFTKVRNIDNLDFTWQDQLRSTIQYAQAWSVMEFMLASPERRVAFKAMLDTFKKEGEKAAQDAGQRNLGAEAARTFFQEALYKVQEAVFKNAYGADLLAVEVRWKDWIRKSYEKDVVKKPLLRYYRGDWYVGRRAEAAKTPEAKESALAKAEAIFTECVSTTPTMPEGYVGLGRVALERGDSERANREFAKATELGTDNFDALLYGGLARVFAGDAAAAVPGFAKAIAQRPTHAMINFYYGQALAISKGDAALTLTHLRRARDLRKELTGRAAMLEGMAEYQGGDFAAAYISFLRAANVEKNNPIPALAMAIVKAANNELEEATTLLTQAAKERNPFADTVQKLLTAGTPPKLVFSRRGWPLVDGVTIPREEADPQKDEPQPKADEPTTK